MTGRSRRSAALLMALAFTQPGRANEDAGALPALRGSMARFAQPIRVGDLAGRTLIEPTEAQAVLGRIGPSPVVRTGDGTLFLAVDWGGFLGLDTTRVLVPFDDVAALGELVVLTKMPPPNAAELRRSEPTGVTPVSADAQVRIAIVGPFH